MQYPITKIVSGILYVFAIYIVFMNYDDPIAYIFLGYSICWGLLTRKIKFGAKYIKILLLCLQIIAIIGMGYLIELELCEFIYIYDDNYSGEGSPLVLLVIIIQNFIFWSMIFASFLEIVLSRRNKVIEYNQEKVELEWL